MRNRPRPRSNDPRPAPQHGGPAKSHVEATRAERAPRDDEGALELTFGLRAALSVFAHRRDDIVRVAYEPALLDDRGVSELVRFADERGLAVGELVARELERFAGTGLHEGLCVEARARRWVPAGELGDRLIAARSGRGGVALALDRVRNPYNVGAILRTAAFFGVDAVLLGAPAPHPALAADAVRVAEGGCEALSLSRTTDLADSLKRLRARGVRVVGADSDPRETASALGYRFGAPTVLVVGHEREGLSDRVLAQCDARVTIAGSGAVESLNVAVATGVLVSELVRGLAASPSPTSPGPASSRTALSRGPR